MILEAPAPETSSLDSASFFRQYLQSNHVSLSTELIVQLENIISTTAWDDPQSGLDLNNCGVIALIESTQNSDLSVRGMYLEVALSAFEEGATSHPLCQAHLALVAAMLGDSSKAMNLAFSCLLWLIQFEQEPNAPELLPGLVFVPPATHPPQATSAQLLSQLLTSGNGYQQCQALLSEVLLRSQMVFYNTMGLRLLQLAAQFWPTLAAVNLRLGISSLMNGQREGMLYLHRAAQAAPDDYAISTSLAVAYQDGGQVEAAKTWQARGMGQLPAEIASLVTASEGRRYVPYDGLWMAVESSFRSIVTAVLLAEGDWFEREVEYWRSQIQPGMVVIDVGANVGVYTFSAAQRVGSTGQVIAVEPFSGCVSHLQATCQANHLEQVKIWRGAASDHQGQIYLALSASSELNEVVTDPTPAQAGRYEEAPCFTLDSICEQENLSQVDFLKIDAEGHELQVLMGSRQLLERFSPIILYENIAGSQGSNVEVAEYLQNIGYQLFCYQPYLQQLIPIEIAADFQGSLNLIALRPV